jgi:hypothetical protein
LSIHSYRLELIQKYLLALLKEQFVPQKEQKALPQEDLADLPKPPFFCVFGFHLLISNDGYRDGSFPL